MIDKLYNKPSISFLYNGKANLSKACKPYIGNYRYFKFQYVDSSKLLRLLLFKDSKDNYCISYNETSGYFTISSAKFLNSLNLDLSGKKFKVRFKNNSLEVQL